MQQYEIFCSGDFITTEDSLSVVNPYTGQEFAQTWLAGEKEFEKAVKAALKVKEALLTMPAWQKYEILMTIGGRLKENMQQAALLLSAESGKPLRYALAEVERAIQVFVVAAEECRRLPGEYLKLDWTPQGTGKEGWVKYFPVGLVAGIAPFNFPLNLAVHKLAPAIASGCPIILKPASSTPLSTLFLAKIIAETDLPKGSISILPMNRQTGNLLVTDDRIKLLSFTGSPEVGWKMKQMAGRKKVVLELGGNAAAIVCADADMDKTLRKCITGGFAYSGQVCIHTQRIYVEKSSFNEFCDEFVKRTLQLRYGDPQQPETEISVMIDQANAIRVENWVNEAISQGARLLCGGKRSGAYFEPTVLTQTKPGMKVRDEEVFGPVVIIESFDYFDQALEQVNDSVFGLQAGVFTNRLDYMNAAFQHLEVGGVIINDVPTFRVDHMPYGGIKESGLGREGVKYAMLDMLEPKLLVKNE